MSNFCGFVPYRSEASWFAAQFDNTATCTACGLDYREDELSEATGLCADCDCKLDAAIVIVGDDSEDSAVCMSAECWQAYEEYMSEKRGRG